MRWTVVPNFRALGPRLGPEGERGEAALAAADGTALPAELEADGLRRGRRRAPRAPTRSRCGPSATGDVRPGPGGTVGRRPRPRARRRPPRRGHGPGARRGRSTTCARSWAWPSPTASRHGAPAHERPRGAAVERPRHWIAGEVLASLRQLGVPVSRRWTSTAKPSV